MIWSRARERCRDAGLALVLASTATVAWLTACAAREPVTKQPDIEASTTQPVESPSAPSAETLPFAWPIPVGWKAETIPFPLGFAPALPYVGVEELRFAPGMFSAGSDEFWTYAFVWWLHGDVAFDAATLNADLASYFGGLSLAVETRESFDPHDAAAVAKLSPADSEETGHARWVGTVSVYDAFVTHARIELDLDVRVFRCAAQDRTVALFTVSPQPEGHAVWTHLAALRDTFRCPE
jgi:hypothetical protein